MALFWFLAGMLSSLAGPPIVPAMADPADRAQPLTASEASDSNRLIGLTDHERLKFVIDEAVT